MSRNDGENEKSAGSDNPPLPEEIAQLTDPSNREDPYPFLDKLRERSPYRPVDGLVVVGRHAHCTALLREPAMSAARDTAALAPTPKGPRTRNFLHLDPPEHTRYRRLVNGAFARRKVEGLAPRIREIATGLLQAAGATGSLEIVEDLANPLPLQLICELLGVPFDDRGLLQDWSAKLSTSLEPPLGPDAGRMSREAARARVEIVAYFRDLIAERRTDPREDLLSHLIGVEENGQRLDDGDILATCVLLLNAGHETSVTLIGNAILALLRHPDQFARLRADPAGLAGPALEEVLRYDAPVQMTTRVAREARRIGDVWAQPGDTVLLLLGAANRDPDVYPDPDRFDIERVPAAPHLAFSGGPHFCLGAGLARLEVGIVLELFSTLVSGPRLRPGGTSYKANLNLRGPERLLVDIDGVGSGS